MFKFVIFGILLLFYEYRDYDKDKDNLVSILTRVILFQQEVVDYGLLG